MFLISERYNFIVISEAEIWKLKLLFLLERIFPGKNWLLAILQAASSSGSKIQTDIDSCCIQIIFLIP